MDNDFKLETAFTNAHKAFLPNTANQAVENSSYFISISSQVEIAPQDYPDIENFVSQLAEQVDFSNPNFYIVLNRIRQLLEENYADYLEKNDGQHMGDLIVKLGQFGQKSDKNSITRETEEPIFV